MTGNTPRSGESIGYHIKRLRDRRMTQAELAASAGVSLELIRKLEQNVRYTASVSSLHKIARALDVDTSELLAKATPLPQPTETTGVVALRRVLTGIDDLLDEQQDSEPATLEDARRSVVYAWGSYWGGKYEQLGETLPNALFDARTADMTPPMADLTAQLYQVAGCTLVHLGHPDAAHMALREALRLAKISSDPLRVAAMRGSLAWLLLTQGRYTESHRLAIVTAESIEPSSKTELPQMSLWGSMLLSAATAAGRDGRSDTAEGLLSEATNIARYTDNRNDYEVAFGPDQAVMQTVDVQVVTEQYSTALNTAKLMPRDTPLPLAARARHLADRALAQIRLGQDQNAFETLWVMQSLAPDWARYQTQPKMIVQELGYRDRRPRNPRLGELARRLGVTGYGDTPQ